MIPATIESTIWDELPASNVDTTKLEHLFESRAKDLLTKVCTLVCGEEKTSSNDLFHVFLLHILLFFQNMIMNVL